MFGWFGRKSVPERQPHVPVWLQGEGEQGGFARGYEAQLDEVYRRNPVGLRAVRLVAGLVGSLPLFGDEKAVELVRTADLLERAAAVLLLHGNAYVRLVTDSHDRPAELHLMRPERVSVVSGADGWPSAYLYRGGGQVARIARDDALGRRQVAHLKALNPTDDLYDPDRDYQTGQMRSSAGIGGTRDERIELPAVLTAGEAKLLVEEALSRQWRGADRIKLRLPPARMALRPGDALQLAGTSRSWTVRTMLIDGMAVMIEGLASPVAVQPLPADPGRPVAEPDVPVGRSELQLFELPADGDAPTAAPHVQLAGSNAGTWKTLPVELQLGAEPIAGISLSRRAVLGRTETALEARCPMVLDELSSVTVRLANGAQLLLNADQDALMAGANLALIGEELIQFGRAEQLGTGLFRLTRLLRGRRGTEWAATSHAAGEGYCLFGRAAIRTTELNANALGVGLTATAHGIGDVAPLPMVQRIVSGESMRPPSPCRLTLLRSGNTLTASWVRRSHKGWTWIDGVGVADDAFPERYRVTASGPLGELTAEATVPSHNFATAQLPGGIGQAITIKVATIGPSALSRDASITITL